MVYQDINRCSAAALAMQLSYWETNSVDYKAIIRRLNPNLDDVSVRIEEMAAHAIERGWGAIVRRGGTIDLLKRLVAGGFPVLVENTYYESADAYRGWLSHNRVLMGYDANNLYFYDSLLGNGDGDGRAFTLDDFDSRWLPFNRDYLVIYAPDQEEALQVILGDNWDEATHWENVLVQAEGDIARLVSPPEKAFATMNKGVALLMLNDPEGAAAAFDEGIRLGLPWRYFWYDFSVFEAYLQVGRYDDLVQLAQITLSSTRGIEELYYYLGKARQAQGDLTLARGNYEVAVYRNSNFAEAIEALASLNAP